MQSYSAQIETALNLTDTIESCRKLFDNFVRDESITIKTEVKFLETVKIFLHRKKALVQENNRGSAVRNQDCLTLSVITCLLASRYDYNVSIGKPNPLSRYFHAVIITSNGKMFKIAGKSNWYGFKRMEPQKVIRRLKLLNPVIGFVDSIKHCMKK